MDIFVCACCGLEFYLQVAQSGADELALPQSMCCTCVRHQGVEPRKRLRRAEEHEKELRRRLEVAVRAALDAHTRKTEIAEELESVLESRAHVLRRVEPMTYHHQPDGNGGCICRARDCADWVVLQDPWLNQLLVDMRRQNATG